MLKTQGSCLPAGSGRRCTRRSGEATVAQIFASMWAAVVAVLVWLGVMAAPGPPSFQGYVEGEFVLVAPTVGGQLVTLAVERGQHVASGDALFALDQADERAALDRAAAMLSQAQDRLSN